MSQGAGAGETRSRGPARGDATVKPAMGALIPAPLRVYGVRSPQGAPLPPYDAPRLRDATKANAAVRRREGAIISGHDPEAAV